MGATTVQCGISCRTCKTPSASDGRVWAYSGSRRAKNAILTEGGSDSSAARDKLENVQQVQSSCRAFAAW